MQSRAVEQDAVTTAKAAPQEREKTERVPLLSGGIHTEKSPDELAPNEVVVCSGMHMLAGRLVVDTGYVPFSHLFLGAAQLEQQYKFADSTTVELLVTSEFVYRYAVDVAQWQFVSSDPIRAVVGAQVEGTFDIPIDDATGLTGGSWVGIQLDDGSQLITQVLAFPAPTTLQLADAVPAGRSVLDGAPVAVAVPLHGDPAQFQVCAVLYAANAWVIFSNNIDPIMYYDHAGDVVKVLGGLPDATTCAAMAVFHGMLFIGNTTEVGTHLPNRVRQSQVGDPEGWTPGTDGIAAIYELLDTPDYILSLKTLGPWLICYRAATVMRASFIGALNEVVYWEYMSQQDGIQSQGAVADVGAAHIIVGTNNVYAYTGDYTLPPIGEAVFQNFLARDGDLYAPAKQTLFCVYVPVLREVWVWYPSSDVAPAPAAPAYPNKVLRYNLALDSWQERVFADPFISAGSYTPEEAITWATAPGQWDDIIWARPWASRINVQNVPNVFLGSPTQTQIFVYDFESRDDYARPIAFELVTRQYGTGGEYTRWEYVNFIGTGAATVEFSEDEGSTWLALGTLNLGPPGPNPVAWSGVSTQTLWVDTVSTRLQLRFTGTDPGFALRYCEIVSVPDSDW